VNCFESNKRSEKKVIGESASSDRIF